MRRLPFTSYSLASTGALTDSHPGPLPAGETAGTHEGAGGYVALLLAGTVAAACAPAFALAAGEPPEALPTLLPFWAFLGAGALAYRLRPAHTAARRLLALGALLCVALAAGTGTVWALHYLGEQPWLWLLNAVSSLCGAAALAAWVGLFAVFPDGRYHRRYERVVVRVTGVVTLGLAALGLLVAPAQSVGFDLAPPSLYTGSPLYVPALAPLAPGVQLQFLAPLLAVGLLAVRYWRFPDERRIQIRLPLLAALLIGVMAAASQPFEPLVAGPAWLQSLVWDVAITSLPATLVVAMLRYRLLDVDLAIRRSLLYGALWLAIALLCTGAAAALGIVAGSGPRPRSPSWSRCWPHCCFNRCAGGSKRWPAGGSTGGG